MEGDAATKADTPPVVVMGVSGSGKSTIGAQLADRLSVRFIDADDLHPPENKAKMAAGIPLIDQDRVPWLRAVARAIRDEGNPVVACSALRRVNRDVLRSFVPGIYFLHLDGGRELLRDRLALREHEFMPAALLDSQFAALEPLTREEWGGRVDVSGVAEDIVDAAEHLVPDIAVRAHLTNPV